MTLESVTSARLSAAEGALKEADVAYKELCRALPRDMDQAEWERQEQEALRGRGEGMKIFDIQMEKGTLPYT